MGIVLAAAGLKRLGLDDRIRMAFDVSDMLPAAGQGALGIEVRADRAELLTALTTLAHRPTWLAVAERAGCDRPAPQPPHRRRQTWQQSLPYEIP